VVSARAEILYKTSDYYAPQWERTLLWNDPALNIPWPLVDGKPPILSSKDAVGLPLSQAETYE
jgi:dTDP-4-dehydrorhamnose 3,5-epimerase